MEIKPTDWNSACLNSIRRQKAEIAKRYNIRFGQTEIYCSRCARSWGFGHHVCQDVRLKKLSEAQKSLKRTPKTDVPLSQADLVGLNAPGML